MSMRTLLSIVALASLFVLPGCHCCGWTECYADRIDDAADHCDFRPGMENCYNEKFDPTRWCMNRNCRNGQCSRCR